MNKRKSILIGAFLLLISGTALAFVLPPRVSWDPTELKPASIAPGQSASFTVKLKHTGRLPIPATNQLKILPSTALLPYVTVTPPSFPPVFKRGNQTDVTFIVTVPQGTPVKVVEGNLMLARVLPNGKVKEVWRADALPVELTFSAIPLPPDPGELGKMTIEGIDIGGPEGVPNGVRDDIDRYIGFTFPNSEKARMGLTQYAKEDQKFVVDFLAAANDPVEQKRVTRENDVEGMKAQECLYYSLGERLLGSDEIFLQAVAIREKLTAQFLNTAERQQVYLDADYLLGGTGGGDRGDDRTLCQGFGFDPDLLPN